MGFFFFFFLITQSMLMKHTSNLLCFVYVDQVSACLFLEQVLWTFFFFLTTQNMMPKFPPSFCFLFVFGQLALEQTFTLSSESITSITIREASFKISCVITNFLGFNREFSNNSNIIYIYRVYQWKCFWKPSSWVPFCIQCSQGLFTC